MHLTNIENAETIRNTVADINQRQYLRVKKGNPFAKVLIKKDVYRDLFLQV